MKKMLAMIFLVGFCTLTPRAARADDGGFWDMLFRWDTAFFGYGTDFHVVCLNDHGERVEDCEEWFRNLPHLFRPLGSAHAFASLGDIKHEFNLRVSYLRSRGQRIPDDKLGPGETDGDDRRIHALKLMLVYYYRANRHLDVGGGLGGIPIFGKDIRDNPWRGIATVSAVYWPASPTSRLGIFFVRTEVSYLTNTITGADFGHPTSSLVIDPEPNIAVTFGFDLRRVGRFNVARGR